MPRVISIKIGSGEESEEEREREWPLCFCENSSEEFTRVFVQTISFSRDTLITHTHSAYRTYESSYHFAK